MTKITEKNVHAESITQEAPEHSFSKEQILQSKTIDYNKDVLNTILSGEKQYTLKELKQIVIDFNARREERR